MRCGTRPLAVSIELGRSTEEAFDRQVPYVWAILTTIPYDLLETPTSRVEARHTAHHTPESNSIAVASNF